MIRWSGRGFLLALVGVSGMVAGVLRDPLLVRLSFWAQSGPIVGCLGAIHVNRVMNDGSMTGWAGNPSIP